MTDSKIDLEDTAKRKISRNQRVDVCRVGIPKD